MISQKERDHLERDGPFFYLEKKPGESDLVLAGICLLCAAVPSIKVKTTAAA
jgi:hypothetical protein